MKMKLDAHMLTLLHSWILRNISEREFDLYCGLFCNEEEEKALKAWRKNLIEEKKGEKDELGS